MSVIWRDSERKKGIVSKKIKESKTEVICRGKWRELRVVQFGLRVGPVEWEILRYA
jgi:hypothetical protein